MTDVADTDHGAPLTDDEVSDLFSTIMGKMDAQESLISDLIGIMVELDPHSMGRLRDSAFRSLAHLHRIADRAPHADHWELFWRTRARMLEVPLQRAGHPYEPVPVVDLAAYRTARL